MKLTEEIDLIEQRMHERADKQLRSFYAFIVALTCFGLLAFCWGVAMLLNWVRP